VFPNQAERALASLSPSSCGICSIVNSFGYWLNRKSTSERRSRRDHRVPGWNIRV